jgi:hypothetical protein
MRAGRHEAVIRINIYHGYRKGLVASESHKAKRKSKTNRATALFVLYMGWHLLYLPSVLPKSTGGFHQLPAERIYRRANTREPAEQFDRQAKTSMP